MTETISARKINSLALASAQRLKAFLNPLWKALTFSLGDDSVAYKSEICVSIEENRLSVACGTRFLSGARIKGFKVYAAENKYPGPEDLASSVILAVNELKMPVKSALTLSIPKAWAVIKIAQFPAAVKENLSGAVSYELDRLTPFSPEDAFYDFRELKEEDGKLSVLITAAKSDLITPYVDALKEKGLNVNRLAVNILGMDRLCRQINWGKSDDFMFVEIGEKGIDGIVSDNGFLTAAFSDKFPADDEKTKIETIIGDMAPYIKMSTQKGKSLRILAHIKDKNPVIREMLKIRSEQPLTMLDETDVNIGIQKSNKDIPYAAVAGVLESLQPGHRLNLLAKGTREASSPPLTLTIVLVLAIIALLVVYALAPLRAEEERIAEIDYQIMQRKDEVKKAEALKKELESVRNDISLINSFKENKPMALNIIKELALVLPKNAWLSRARITGATVEIEGNSASTSDLLPKLEASKYFEKVEIASPTYKDPRMNTERFSIKMAIEGIEKEKTSMPVQHPQAAENTPKQGVKNGRK